MAIVSSDLTYDQSVTVGRTTDSEIEREGTFAHAKENERRWAGRGEKGHLPRLGLDSTRHQKLEVGKQLD